LQLGLGVAKSFAMTYFRASRRCRNDLKLQAIIVLDDLLTLNDKIVVFDSHSSSTLA